MVQFNLLVNVDDIEHSSGSKLSHSAGCPWIQAFLAVNKRKHKTSNITV